MSASGHDSGQPNTLEPTGTLIQPQPKALPQSKAASRLRAVAGMDYVQQVSNAASPESGDDGAAAPDATDAVNAAEEERHAGIYTMRGGQLYMRKPSKTGLIEVPLASFTVLILSEIRYDEGDGHQELHFELAGQLLGRQPSRIVLRASEFAAMNWPLERWGAYANIHAGAGNREHVRSAIQALSIQVGIAGRTIHRHLGWIQHAQHGPLYLTAGAVIGAQGPVSGITVEVPGRLTAYALPRVPVGPEMIACIRASLALVNLAPDTISFPVLGAALRAVLGKADFTVFIVGRTGSHKTTFTALVMAHFGSKWRHDHLPEGWASTANALERHAFIAKDTLFGVDDFKPVDPRDPVYRSLSKLLRGQADGAGRSRLGQGGQTSQTTYHPRGLMITSAETVPASHSDQARALFVNVNAPLLGPNREKSAAFYEAAELGGAGVYAGTLAGLVQHIAQNWSALHAEGAAHQKAVQDLTRHFNGVQGHDRTPRICGELTQGWRVFLNFAVSAGAVTRPEADALLTRAIRALRDVASTQITHHEDVDPVTRFLQLLRELFSSRRAVVEDALEGKVPKTTLSRWGGAPIPNWGTCGNRRRHGWAGWAACRTANCACTSSPTARWRPSTSSQQTVGPPFH